MSTEAANSAGQKTPTVPGCTMCEQLVAPETTIVCETDLFVGYVTPVYPWSVVLTTRRHECEGPWALTEDEAADMGRLSAIASEAIRKTGSERVYVLQFGEELAVPHFHLALLSRFVEMSVATHGEMWKRVQASTEDLGQVATEFAAAVKAQL